MSADQPSRRALPAVLVAISLIALVGLWFVGLVPPPLRHLGSLAGMIVVLASILSPTLIGPLAWFHAHRGAPRRNLLLAWRIVVGPVLVVVPIVALCASSGFVPSWRGAATHGVWSCVHAGNLAWLPLALWAAAAMYMRHAAGMRGLGSFVTHGMLAGVVTGLVLTLTHARSVNGDDAALFDADVVRFFGWFPMATLAVYGAAFVHAAREEPPTGRGVGLLAAALPITGAVHVHLARKCFDGLAPTPPDCYVVTAAAKGHARLVRPIGETLRGSRVIRVTAQLVVLWALEAAWRTRHPRTHRLARRAYDVVGPLLARVVDGPFRADLAYLSLKPLEWAARLALHGRIRSRRSSGTNPDAST